VNPGYEIDDFITELTGITNGMLAEAPILPDVLPQFISFIGSDVIIAHNANFDINFIYDSLTKHSGKHFKNDFIDTMRISRRMFQEHRCHTLNHLVERFELPHRAEHRAMTDTELVHKSYEYMKKHAKDNGIDFDSLYPKSYGVRAKDIKTSNTEFDEDTPVYGNEFVFTGTLEKMPRKDAMQIVVDMGGLCSSDITKKTNFLVLGNLDYSKSIKDGKSRKQKKAESLELSGSDIQIISENVFYDMVSVSLPPLHPKDYELKKQQDILERKQLSHENISNATEQRNTVKISPLINRDDITINPLNDRCPLSDIRNSSDWDKGFKDGYHFWEKGEDLRKSGSVEDAILLFDKARYNGYSAPALYTSYAMAYDKLKDYNNLIQILDEGISRNIQGSSVKAWEPRRCKAVQQLHKQIETKRIADEKAEEKLEKTRQKEEAKKAKQSVSRPVGRPILQLSNDMELIKKHDSIANAVRDTGVNSKSIRDAANGVQKGAGGFKWQFDDSE